ncbi:MAG: hypothetical protein QME58_13900 [Bacteroidota bacterium]|nr:hypothetical protein [Bacteroidota bacterium]
MKKKWYQSKIIWVNIISLLLELANSLLDMNVLPAGTLLIIVNGLNIILRLITKYPIGDESQQ